MKQFDYVYRLKYKGFDDLDVEVSADSQAEAEEIIATQELIGVLVERGHLMAWNLWRKVRRRAEGWLLLRGQ